MGMSRYTFYRYQQAAEQGGVEALLNQNRRVSNSKNRVVNHTWEVGCRKSIILSESQVQALERKKEDDIACG